MPQKIKKQIKRSMPWLLIFSLIFSTVVSGLIFNLDVKISNKINDKLGIELTTKEVLADTATTTVTVKNAPPAFTVDAAEVPSSTSTSPVNVGASIAFTARADDPEDNSYYFIVCSAPGVSVTAGNAPTCTATTFCTSVLTGDETDASCIYNNVADPSAETDDWYAYVCDDHGVEPDCSENYNQGTQPGIGDNSSPLYVNHAPNFTAVATTDNNKDPGGNFTITASAVDADVMRGSELMHLYVCNTNSWATSTGCAGGQICHATSTSPDIDCTFATTTPAIDGNWTYYGFVMDDFGMAATGNSRSSTYHVNNVAPQVTNVVINGGINIRLNLKNAAFNAEATTTSTSIRDNNGCTDIVGATSTIYLSDVAGEDNCTANNNDCYKIAQAYCIAEAGSCTGPTDDQMTYTCSTTMEFHANPSDNSTNNPDTLNKWLGAIAVFDEALHVVATTSFASGVEVITNTALEVTEVQIPYGSIKSGQDSGTSTATTTITNYGNSPLDTDLTGTWMEMAPSYTIGENWQEWSLTYQFEWGAGPGTDLSSTTAATVNTDTSKPTSLTDVSDYIYWGIGIPSGQQSGVYEGQNTFTAALDDDNW